MEELLPSSHCTSGWLHPFTQRSVSEEQKTREVSSAWSNHKLHPPPTSPSPLVPMSLK